MAAAATDKFVYVGRGTATTLSSPGYTAGGTSINVASTTNWPTTTGVIFAMDEIELVEGEWVRVDGTFNSYQGTVASATQIDNVDHLSGDGDRNYSAGATTRVYILVDKDRENRMVDGILVEHNQDGTHSDVTATTVTASGNIQTTAGAVITDTISEDTAANGVAIDGMTIKDGKVVGGAAVGVANSSLDTTAGELGGAWADWTHSFAGFTGGSETVNAKYTQIGKTIHFRLTATLGANPSAVTNFTFNLPITANSAHSANTAINGGSTAKDANGGIVPMVAYFQNTTSMFVRAIDSGTTYNTIATPSTVIPFAWASGDILTVSGTYEAA